MRVIVGLDAPTSGSVTVNGRRYREHPAPLQEVGVLLEARSIHPGRTAYSHLRGLALTHGIPASRVDEVIDLAGLASVAHQLGPGRSRSAWASGSASPLPSSATPRRSCWTSRSTAWTPKAWSGSAPCSPAWAEGRTVFVSSHLMSEMAQTATSLIIVGAGKLLADTTVEEFTRTSSASTVHVSSDSPARLRDLLAGPDVTVSGAPGSEELQVTGRTARQVGQLAASHGIALYGLRTQSESLEEAFMAVTGDSVEYRATRTA